MKITIDSEEILCYSIELRKKLALETKSISLMVCLSDDSDTRVLISLSLNSDLPNYLIKKLFMISDDITLKENLARHENTDEKTLFGLAGTSIKKTKYHKGEMIFYHIVQHPSANKETLDLLIKSPYVSEEVQKMAKVRLQKEYC